MDLTKKIDKYGVGYSQMFWVQLASFVGEISFAFAAFDGLNLLSARFTVLIRPTLRAV